jgi:hypothetical protein
MPSPGKGRSDMRGCWKVALAVAGLPILGIVLGTLGVQAQTGPKPAPSPSSYLPVIEDDFGAVFTRMSGAKATIMRHQLDLLNARYDLSDRPAGVTMSRGKPLQEGVRVKLPGGKTDLVAFLRAL